MQVKSNQPTLLEDCIYTAKKCQKSCLSYSCDVEKNRNRIEQRSIKVFNDFEITNESWGHIAQLGEISRSIERYNTKDGTWSPSHETCYFVSTTILTAKDFLDFTRKHWGIENSNHYVRDVTFQEDKSRIRKNPFNMAILRSFALNVLRYNGAKSIQNERYRCSINSAAIKKYKGIWDF